MNVAAGGLGDAIPQATPSTQSTPHPLKYSQYSKRATIGGPRQDTTLRVILKSYGILSALRKLYICVVHDVV
jgi:hypothetical protein